MRRTHKTRRAGTAAAGRADARQSARSPRRVAQRGPSNPRTNAPNPQSKTRGHSSGGEGGRASERPQPPTRRAARTQQPTSKRPEPTKQDARAQQRRGGRTHARAPAAPDASRSADPATHEQTRSNPRANPQQPTSEPAATHERTRSNPRTNLTRYETTPRKPPRRGGGRGSAFRRVVAVKGRLPPAQVAASAPQRGLQQPTSK